MSKAEELAKVAREMRERQQLAKVATERPTPAVTGHRDRVKPVRRTVDLSPVEHTKLAAWCAATATDMGTARVTGQDVLRALVARLLTDEQLAGQIRADLQQSLSKY